MFLQAANKKVVVVGCGECNLMRGYKGVHAVPFTVRFSIVIQVRC